jgi:hypothetical protein
LRELGIQNDGQNARNTSLLDELLDKIESLLCFVADPVGRLLHSYWLVIKAGQARAEEHTMMGILSDMFADIYILKILDTKLRVRYRIDQVFNSIGNQLCFMEKGDDRSGHSFIITVALLPQASSPTPWIRVFAEMVLESRGSNRKNETTVPFPRSLLIPQAKNLRIATGIATGSSVRPRLSSVFDSPVLTRRSWWRGIYCSASSLSCQDTSSSESQSERANEA